MEINAETLRRIRDKKGMNQKEFAEFLGISERSLQDYEGNKTKITPGKKLLIQHKLAAESADLKESSLEGNQINEKDIPKYIIENEDKLLKNQTFRLWITSKVQEGIINSLKRKKE